MNVIKKILLSACIVLFMAVNLTGCSFQKKDYTVCEYLELSRAADQDILTIFVQTIKTLPRIGSAEEIRGYVEWLSQQKDKIASRRQVFLDAADPLVKADLYEIHDVAIDITALPIDILDDLIFQIEQWLAYPPTEAEVNSVADNFGNFQEKYKPYKIRLDAARAQVMEKCSYCFKK